MCFGFAILFQILSVRTATNYIYTTWQVGAPAEIAESAENSHACLFVNTATQHLCDNVVLRASLKNWHTALEILSVP